MELADDFCDKLSKGDAALLRFAAAAEILESDFWVQFKFSIRTSPNIFTTTPMTRLLTLRF